MPQSLVQFYAHITFSTKDRRPFLADADVRNRLHSYLVGTCRNLDSPSLSIGGVEDHVHILCRLGKTHSIAEIIRELKRESSKRLKEDVPEFYWQRGYGAFSLSPSHVDRVVAYIAGQEEHHRTVTFEDEFRQLCAKYGVDIDERYVWD